VGTGLGVLYRPPSVQLNVLLRSSVAIVANVIWNDRLLDLLIM